ncbi:unnamed protein product [Somion occarium]|uniref:F-box domain-containing protein n=1 Tax=Somion occarium TaxID=3059160 RepID=A0ABP1E5J6_9APHY
MNRLPVELLFAILNHLPRSDLPPVALTSRTLRSCTEPILYAHVTLDVPGLYRSSTRPTSPDDVEYSHDLARSLLYFQSAFDALASPLARLVRILTITGMIPLEDCNPTYFATCYPGRDHLNEMKRMWRTFCFALEQMSELREFTSDCLLHVEACASLFKGPKPNLRVVHLPGYCHPPVERILMLSATSIKSLQIPLLPSLTSLSFRAYNPPPDLLELLFKVLCVHAPQLTKLVWLILSDGLVMPPETNFQSLKDLEGLWDSLTVFSSSQFPKLLSLSLNGPPAEHRLFHLSDLLPQLESLEIAFSTPPEVLTLPPTLRVIRLTGDPYSIPRNEELVIQCISQLSVCSAHLHFLPSLPALTVLRLYSSVFVDDPEDCGTWEHRHEKELRSFGSQVLSRLPVLQSLSVVKPADTEVDAKVFRAQTKADVISWQRSVVQHWKTAHSYLQHVTLTPSIDWHWRNAGWEVV